MRSSVIVGLAVAAIATSASRAHADDATWEGVLVGSVGVALAGGALVWHGTMMIDHAEENLCTGAYADSCDHRLPTRPSELAHYNDNGNAGDRDVKLGAALLAGGTVLGVVALIEAYVVHKDTETMTIAPAVTPTGAGATFQIHW